MEENIKNLLNSNEVLKDFLFCSKEELNILRIIFNLNLVTIRKNENTSKASFTKLCLYDKYNLLDYMLMSILDVEPNIAKSTYDFDKLFSFSKCDDCPLQNCIKKDVGLFISEIEKFNSNNGTQIAPLDVIDYILQRKQPIFYSVPDENFFNNVDLIDLIFVHVILECDLILLNSKQDDNTLTFDYLDLTQKDANVFYVNLLYNFYRSHDNCQSSQIKVDNFEEILSEKDQTIRIYKIAAYYKYIIEYEKRDIIKALREYVQPNKLHNNINTRSHYFTWRYFKKVENLPYSSSTKNTIFSLLNYLLNYRFKTNTPYIPINLIISSTDKGSIKEIADIIGEFAWFFGYLPNGMKYYDSYFNDIILDNFVIKKLYLTSDNKKKTGIMIFHNFDNLLCTDSNKQNLILNILTDEIEANSQVINIIYAENESIKKLMNNHSKLANQFTRLDLEFEGNDIDNIYKLLLNKLLIKYTIPSAVKEKIYNYIKVTYSQAKNKNFDYINKLYNAIVLNANKIYPSPENYELTLENIPEAYNTKNLPEIMKDLDSLVGLDNIKEQINDLVYLLKFNKKANLDISTLNLHTIFSGNPGTGKTTVARILKDILYNLGYIPQNKITEVIAKDLIAEYIGQTSGKTFNVIQSAIGGILFIDEAYSIMSATQFGDECIATLIKSMEDYKDKLVIIFAGYENDMKNFISSNPGLISRIGYQITFPDYSLEELTKIFTNLLSTNNLTITDTALDKVKNVINASLKYENFGNGRFVHNIFQKILIEHSKNIENATKKVNLYEIVDEDINSEKIVFKAKNNTKIGF